MIHLTLFTGIQDIKFTAVGERAVHITIAKKICRNFVIMQRTLSYCSCFTICKRQVNFSGKYPANLYRIPDSAGCLNFTGYRIPVSGSGTSLILLLSCSSVVQIYEFLLYKVWCFIEISSTDKNDNLTCEIIIHDNLTCENYRFSIIAFL